MILENAPYLSWRPGKLNSVVGALADALEYIGSGPDYVHLMGASGAAFRVQIRSPVLDPSAPHAGLGRRLTDSLGDVAGRQITWLRPPSDGTPDRRPEAVAASLEAGIPALILAEEAGLIVGCDDHGEDGALRFLHDSYNADERQWLEEWTWQVVGIVGPRRPGESLPDLFRNSVNAAVDLFCDAGGYDPAGNREAYLVGRRAIESWIEILRNPDFSSLPDGQVPRMMLGNHWCFATLGEARARAADWLERGAPTFGNSATDVAGTAALNYREIVRIVREALPGIPRWRPQMAINLGGMDIEGAIDWSPGARQLQADALQHVLDRETAAIESLRELQKILD